MHSQGRRDQVYERGSVTNLSIAEEFGAGDVSARAVSFQALPIEDRRYLGDGLGLRAVTML
jgi:hypothetical protein